MYTDYAVLASTVAQHQDRLRRSAADRQRCRDAGSARARWRLTVGSALVRVGFRVALGPDAGVDRLLGADLSYR